MGVHGWPPPPPTEFFIILIVFVLMGWALYGSDGLTNLLWQ